MSSEASLSTSMVGRRSYTICQLENWLTALAHLRLFSAPILLSFSEEERRNFRLLRGVQGQTAGVRHAQAYIQERLPEYQPEGLRDFLEPRTCAHQ